MTSRHQLLAQSSGSARTSGDLEIAGFRTFFQHTLQLSPASSLYLYDFHFDLYLTVLSEQHLNV